MRIEELFSRPIDRKIEEVIKVDDESTILTEVEEYIPTDHIEAELTEVLDKFQETILNPSETVNIWVSGFFGSGKSSFAKVLGYLIANPEIGDKRLADRFFELNEIPRARQLLSTIHSQIKVEAVLLDLATSPNVLREGEPVVLPVYRTLLESLGYSRDVTLAELEYALEGPEETIDLEQFLATYESVHGRSWNDDRNIITAKNRASRVLHRLDPDTYPSADSWSNAASAPEINANWFANRALDMLSRRRPGTRRLVFIVDEVGQYVARSAKLMLGLQGLAEACQKKKGELWLLATSQEKLTDVVDSLEGKQTELAKAVDRFPIRVDLLPSDIDEVTGPTRPRQERRRLVGCPCRSRQGPEQAHHVRCAAVRSLQAVQRRGLRSPLSAGALPAPGPDRRCFGPARPGWRIGGLVVDGAEPFVVGVAAVRVVPAFDPFETSPLSC